MSEIMTFSLPLVRPGNVVPREQRLLSIPMPTGDFRMWLPYPLNDDEWERLMAWLELLRVGLEVPDEPPWADGDIRGLA